MIVNIIDKRRRPFRWRSVNLAAEATNHDNAIADADQIVGTPDDITYEQIVGVSYAEALRWGASLTGAVTLFVYDEGEGTQESGEA